MFLINLFHFIIKTGKKTMEELPEKVRFHPPCGRLLLLPSIFPL